VELGRGLRIRRRSGRVNQQGPHPKGLRLKVLVFGVLGLLAACSNSPTASQEEIEIGIRYSSFRPEKLTVEEGTTVTFVIRNSDPIDHEFILGDEEVQRVHELGTEAHHGAKPGEVSIPAGTERTTTYTFEESGTLIYGCHLPGHYGYGMKGSVTVSS
jgi:uncharacterized cupredoxin-like copper-binding protein